MHLLRARPSLFAAAMAAIGMLLLATVAMAQMGVADGPETPFKLATFATPGEVGRVGMVLGDRILDLEPANLHLRQEEGLGAVDIPNEMRSLIESYDRVKSRLYQMANYYKGTRLEGAEFAYPLGEVSIEAPIKYPYNLIAAAANYRSHAAEMSVTTPVDPDADDPYMFAKSPRSCIIDPGQPYFIPKGRDKIDWEGELAVVMGKEVYEASLGDAMDYVFGFTIMYDVSDRGGGTRPHPMFPGPDWFSGKSRTGAAPMGPYIVPKEFLPHYDDLHLVTRVNDRIVQDASTKDLIYDVPHLIRYITSILTLYPGDVISTGTPDGVGAGRKPPEFLKPGDVVTIEIEGIGTLRTPIKATPSSTD